MLSYSVVSTYLQYPEAIDISVFPCPKATVVDVVGIFGVSTHRRSPKRYRLTRVRTHTTRTRNENISKNKQVPPYGFSPLYGYTCARRRRRGGDGYTTPTSMREERERKRTRAKKSETSGGKRAGCGGQGRRGGLESGG